MRIQLAALGIAVLSVVAATAFFTNANRTDAPAAEAAPLDVQDAVVVSFDGTEIALTVFRPEGASAAAPVPVVLHSHGWSGSRADALGDYAVVDALVAAGFGVVSVDARGHGDSGGFATVHHKDAEVRDFQAVLDWIHDELDWIQKETDSGVPRDVVAGAAGYSYGGGFQLMLASYDDRLDAIAPEITWNFLPDSLAPDGVVKSVWVHFLYGIAKESGTRIDPRIEEWYQAAMTTNRLPLDAQAHFAGSSPIVENIDADVLLIQGIPDVLFNLNHALWTYGTLESTGTSDVRLFTHLSGHVLPGAQPFGTMQQRRNVFEDVTPCGTLSETVVAWLDERLRGGPASGIPEVSYALDDGSCATFHALPAADVTLGLMPLVAPSGAGSVVLPLLDGPQLVAGIPRLRANVSDAAAEGIAFASLVVVSPDGRTRVIDDQARPFRYAPGQSLDVEMVAVAGRVEAGERLALRIDGLNEWFVTNSARTPGAALLEDVELVLPLVAPAEAAASQPAAQH